MASKTLKFLPAKLRPRGVGVVVVVVAAVVVVVVAENLHGIYYLFLFKTTFFHFKSK